MSFQLTKQPDNVCVKDMTEKEVYELALMFPDDDWAIEFLEEVAANVTIDEDGEYNINPSGGFIRF